MKFVIIIGLALLAIIALVVAMMLLEDDAISRELEESKHDKRRNYHQTGPSEPSQ